MPHAPDMIPPGPKANVLAAIKERGRATVGELAAALGVTRACVHSHLTALKRAELVRKTGVVQVGRGRPEHTFELTEAGDRLFPKNYAGMLNDLLDQIKRHYGPTATLDLLEERNTEWARDWCAAIEDLPVPQKLEQLAEHLSQAGYQARVLEQQDRLVLALGNCPCPRTALAHPEVCIAEQRLHERVLGTQVRRASNRIVEGNACCRYVVSTKDQITEPPARDSRS